MAKSKQTNNDSKLKYYSLDRILDTNADYHLIWGQRGNGKSYSMIKYCLEQYKSKGVKFAYLRRWEKDITNAKAAKLFTSENGSMEALIESMFGKGYSIKHKTGTFYLYDDNDQNIGEIGYILAINDAMHTKSIPFNNVKTVIFDEFIPMKGERRLNDEISLFENTISTILRTNTNAKVFLLANSITKFSPYFQYFGININGMQQGQLIVREVPYYGGILRIAAEYCEFNEEIAKRTSKWTAHNKMIVKGEWEIKDTAEIPTAVNEVATEKLLFSVYNDPMLIDLGVFVRTAVWSTFTLENYCYKEHKHIRQFLVIRQIAPDAISPYYHLTNQKSVSNGNWSNWNMMIKDIYEGTGIDVEREFKMLRVFAEDSFTADYFTEAYNEYLRKTMIDLL